MATPARATLVSGDIAHTLRDLTLPSAVGMLAMIAVNLIDTYWVSRLGTAELAALSFIFPIESLTVNIGLGLMIGMSTGVARAVGSGDTARAARLVTHSIGLSVAILVGVAALGWFLHPALFRALGVDEVVLAHISAYMQPWLIGVVCLMVPMLANGALRAVGDVQTPMRVMLLGACLNAVLDPILIFGLGPIPGLGLRGAGMATMISRAVVMGIVCYVLVRRSELIDRARPRFAEVVESARSVLRVGVPAVIANALGPLAVALMTGIVAGQGAAALAAWGTGIRVDALALMAPFALSGALSPFIGQNWGAHLRKRVADGIRQAVLFSVGWGIAAAALLIVAADQVASLFTDDPEVRRSLVIYLRTIPVGYAFIASVAVTSSVFNAVDRAVRATALSALRSIALALPAAWIGAQVQGFSGLCVGLVIASAASAVLGVHWMRGLLLPSGEPSEAGGTPLSLPAAVAALNAAARPRAEGLLREISRLEDVQLRHVRGGLVGVYVGAREIAHLHPDGRIDLPLPIEIGDNLVARGVCTPHAEHPDNGWYSHDTAGAPDAEGGTWLLRLSHLLYEMSYRGPGDPVTRAELDAFTVSDQCVAAMSAAATRWGLRLERPSRDLIPAPAK